MVVSGDTLYKAAVSGDSISSLLADLKTHVKKDNVALPYVPKYFEALSIVMDSQDPALQSLAFSVICHLVKRVSIQDKSGEILAGLGFLVLPMVIPRIADSKASTSASARRALEAYWLLAPEKVEQALIDVGLTNRSILLVNECVVWLNHILTEINPHFKLDAFFGPLAHILSKHSSNAALVENIKVLFANFYDVKQNQLHKFELQKVLETHGVSASLRTSIMGTDTVLNLQMKSPEQVLKREERTASATERSFSHSYHHSPEESKHSEPESVSELTALTQSLPNYNVDDSISATHLDDYEALHRMVADMKPFFENKETEKNWMKREKAIQLLRRLIRGNARTEYQFDLFSAIKDVSEGIQKSLLSLRTTLSVSSCQLVKEMAILFGPEFDGLAELFLPTLVKLCSATKHMTHTNANVAVSAIFTNCTLNARFVHRISAAAVDKSTSTRSYAALWLDIYMIRTHMTSPSTPLELVGKLLPRLLGDPNSQVRQSAKDVYWRYRKYWPESSEILLGGLDSNVVRALQRSRPPSEKFALPLIAKKSRPSLKEAIMAKNKQLRARASETRSSSSLLPRRPLDADSEDDIHANHRVASDPLKTPVPRAVKTESSFTRPTYSHQAPIPDKASSASPTNAPVQEISPIPETNKGSPGNSHGTFDQSASFDNRNDPIIKFLSSSQDDFMREGITLLRYALIGDEEISKEITGVVRKVSISNVELLRPFLEEGENLFKKSKRLFSLDDFMRVCAILLPASDKSVEMILSLYDVDDIYDSINTLLSYVADLDNIVDEKLLVMQIIKSKSKILSMLIAFLGKMTVKMPISDVNFAKLTTSLFELVPILHSTPTYPDYQILMQNLHSINKLLFVGQLSLVVKSTKDEIEQIVGIDHTLQYRGDGTVFNMTDLTQISPGKPPLGLSPLKRPSEFTMLIPPKIQESENRDVHEKSFEAPEFIVKSENTDMDIVEDDFEATTKAGGVLTDVVPELVEIENNPVNEQVNEPVNEAHNIFSSGSEGKRNDFFSKLSSPDSSHELAEDFAQVNLTAKRNTIQVFIDKVDPLNKISLKSRPISIFEDSKSGSPQKIREYSYTDFNWFNFLVAKLSLERDAEEFDLYTIDEFKLLCKKLGQSSISGIEFIALLRYLQNQQSPEFSQFYVREGHSLIEQSLWMYFLSSKNTDKLSGLIIVKQLLINRDSINLVHLWHTLVDLSAGDCSHELEVAIGETFDEALCGVYSSAELFHVVSKTLKDPDLNETETLRFRVESLYKLMSTRTLALIINDELIRKVDDVLHGLLDHKDTLVRKNVLQTYGKLLRAARVSETSGGNKSATLEKSGMGSIDDLLVQVTAPQRKLIEFFSQ